MGWKIKLIILILVLLVLFGKISIDKFVPDNEKLESGISGASSGIAEIVKSEVSNASSNIYEGVKSEIFNSSSRVSSDGEKIEIDVGKSSFEFEGSSGRGIHTGTFDEWEGKILLSDADDRPIGVEIKFHTDSVNTGINLLDNHLRSGDFFDAEKYSEATFVSYDLEEGIMKGVLNFKDVEKNLSFPIEIKNKSISSEFFLNVSEFNFNEGIDNVKIEFKIFY